MTPGETGGPDGAGGPGGPGGPGGSGAAGELRTTPVGAATLPISGAVLGLAALVAVAGIRRAS